jgi:hypothetical protein
MTCSITARPGQINYSSGAAGTIGHPSAKLLQHPAEIKLNQLVYRGSGQVVIDLPGGHVGTMFSGMGALQGHARASKIRSPTVTGKERRRLRPARPHWLNRPTRYLMPSAGLASSPPHARPNPSSPGSSEKSSEPRTREVTERLMDIGFDVLASSP